MSGRKSQPRSWRAPIPVTVTSRVARTRGGVSTRGFFGKNRSDEFEIANGDGIENQRVVLFIIADAVEVAEGGLGCGVSGLGGVFAEVVDDGSGGGSACG